MKFVYAVGLSVFVVYIMLQGASIWYLTLVWLVPITVVIWWDAYTSSSDILVTKLQGK